MTVRVLRLLEYVYPNHETAEADMERWQLPADGVRVFGRPSPHDKVTISSTTMMPRTVAADEINKPPQTIEEIAKERSERFH